MNLLLPANLHGKHRKTMENRQYTSLCGISTFPHEPHAHTHTKKGPTSATEPTCNYTKSLNWSIIYSWVFCRLSFLSIRTSRLSNFFWRTMQAFYGILTCKVNRACQDCQEKHFCHSSRLRAGCSVGKKSGCLSFDRHILIQNLQHKLACLALSAQFHLDIGNR